MYEIFEQILQQYGISAYRFCKDTGISQSTISTWKRNKNLISGEIAQIIVDYFKISLEYLMTGKEKDGGETYYLNDETKEIAQEIFENKDMRTLFDVARNVSPEHLKAYAQFLKELQQKEQDTGD